MKAPSDPKVAAPGVGQAYLAQHRQQFAKQILVQFPLGLAQLEVSAQATAKAIPSACTEDQAFIPAALAVGDLSAVFAERLTLLQADLGQIMSG